MENTEKVYQALGTLLELIVLLFVQIALYTNELYVLLIIVNTTHLIYNYFVCTKS